MNNADSDATYCEEIENEKKMVQTQSQDINMLLSGGQRFNFTPTQERSISSKEIACKKFCPVSAEKIEDSQLESRPKCKDQDSFGTLHLNNFNSIPSPHKRTRSQVRRFTQSQVSSADPMLNSQLENQKICSPITTQNQELPQQDNKAILSYCRQKLKEIQSRIKQKNITQQETPIFEKELKEIKSKVSDKRIKSSIDTAFQKLRQFSDPQSNLQEVPAINPVSVAQRKRKLIDKRKQRCKRKRLEVFKETHEDLNDLINFNDNSMNEIDEVPDLNASLPLISENAIEPYEQFRSKEYAALNEILQRSKLYFQQAYNIKDEIPTVQDIKPIAAPNIEFENPVEQLIQPVLLNSIKSESLFSYVPDELNIPAQSNNSMFEEGVFLLGQKCDASLMEYDDVMDTSFQPIQQSTPSYLQSGPSSICTDFFGQNFKGDPFHETESDDNQHEVNDYSYEDVYESKSYVTQNCPELKEDQMFFNAVHLRLLAERLCYHEQFLKICILETFHKAAQMQEGVKAEVSSPILLKKMETDTSSDSAIPCSPDPYENLRQHQINRKNRYSVEEINHPISIKNFFK